MANPMVDSVFNADQAVCQICHGAITFSRYMSLQDKNSLVCGATYCKQLLGEKETLPAGIYRIRVEQHRRLVREARVRDQKRREYQDS